MNKSHDNLVSRLLHGLADDCRSLYPSEESEATKFFSAVNFLSSSEDGCLELCRIGKAIETSLITGEPLKIDFVTLFNKCKAGTALPESGFFLWSRVFHVATRTPLIRYDADLAMYRTFEPESLSTEASYQNVLCREQLNQTGLAVFLLRQTFLIHSKREDLPVIAIEDDEVSAFVERVTRVPNICTSRQVLRTAREYLRRIFIDEDANDVVAPIAQWCANPFGRHGPGAVYNGEKGREKWEFCASINSWITHPEFIDPTTEASASRCRLSVVPKDFRKHRLICIEQKESMFYQQGLRAVIEFLVHSNPISAQSVSYIDQGLNFRLSKRRNVSTIDLSDASDYVSLRLVKLLFPKEIYKLLVNGRSTRIELPSGIDIAYKSMYTMGNALCFTVETLVFSALTAAAISTVSGRALSRCARLFRVFGDDVIVDSRYFKEVCAVLQSAGLVINEAKACHNSMIRESCGSWFFGGLDVRIFRPVTMQIVSDRDWLSWLQIIMNLSSMGLLSTATEITSFLDQVYPVPEGYFGIPGSPELSRRKTHKGSKVWRWNIQFQREEFLMPAFEADQMTRLDGRKGLYAYFTRQATTFPSNLKTIRRWIPLE